MALKDSEEGVQNAAAIALGKMGPAAVPALIETLKNSDYAIRRYAAGALREIGPTAKDAVPALTEALKAGDVHDAACGALWRIDPAAAKAINDPFDCAWEGD